MKNKKILLSSLSTIGTISLASGILVSCKQEEKKENALFVTKSNLWSNSVTFIFSNEDETDFELSKGKEKIYKFEYWDEAGKSGKKEADFSIITTPSLLKQSQNSKIENQPKNIAVVKLQGLEQKTNYKFQVLKLDPETSKMKPIKISEKQEYEYSFTTEGMPEINKVEVKHGVEDSSTQISVVVTLENGDSFNQNSDLTLHYEEIEKNDKNQIIKKEKKVAKNGTLKDNTLTFNLDKLNKDSNFIFNKITKVEGHGKYNPINLTWENQQLPKLFSTNSDVLSITQCFDCHTTNDSQSNNSSPKNPPDVNNQNSNNNANNETQDSNQLAANENSDASQNNNSPKNTSPLGAAQSKTGKKEIYIKLKLAKPDPSKRYTMIIKKWDSTHNDFYKEDDAKFEKLESTVLGSQDSETPMLFVFKPNENAEFEDVYSLETIKIDDQELIINKSFKNKNDIRNEFKLKSLSKNNK